jgi:hypothetical protein
LGDDRLRDPFLRFDDPAGAVLAGFDDRQFRVADRFDRVDL